MEYKRFYLAIRRYAKNKITRGEFRIEWKDAQRHEGIEPKKQRLIGAKVVGWV
jgi:hypothetical protein